jgi:ArsR family transcriptional regulator, arsenate/arsenite/antimonite-responsive transcriptional repressor
MEEHDAVQALSALAQDTRLRIFRQLVVTGHTGLTPGQLAEALDASPTALSFHLKELLHAGLVTVQRDGRFLIYRADVARMNSLLGFLTDNCCQGEPCLTVALPTCQSC